MVNLVREAHAEPAAVLVAAGLTVLPAHRAAGLLSVLVGSVATPWEAAPAEETARPTPLPEPWLAHVIGLS